MRLSTSLAFSALGCVGLLEGAHAWGAAGKPHAGGSVRQCNANQESTGHEIVATIAQMYLHPSVLPTLCSILEMPSHKCHLAPVAAWADQHRMQMRWSASLHYVGALDDHPSQTCAFPGTRGWAGNPGINVLDGVKNVTSLLQAWVEEDASDAVANEALKFLIHFVGDLHQPLHLTGRDRGGNSVKVLFDRRHTSKLPVCVLYFHLIFLRPTLFMGWSPYCEGCENDPSELYPPSSVPANRTGAQRHHLRLLCSAYHVGRRAQLLDRRRPRLALLPCSSARPLFRCLWVSWLMAVRIFSHK